jgi:hypothetical protein
VYIRQKRVHYIREERENKRKWRERDRKREGGSPLLTSTAWSSVLVGLLFSQAISLFQICSYDIKFTTIKGSYNMI